MKLECANRARYGKSSAMPVTDRVCVAYVEVVSLQACLQHTKDGSFADGTLLGFNVLAAAQRDESEMLRSLRMLPACLGTALRGNLHSLAALCMPFY